MRIGILSGGGDCPGINAVIRAVVLAARRDRGWEVIGIENGFDGLLNPDHTRPLRVVDVRGIISRGGTILGTTNRANPFAYRVVRDGQVEERERSGEVIRAIKRLGIDALIVIGGDGSLKITQELVERGVQAVGIPKTIDNDLSATDYTFGYHSALEIATEAIDRLQTTAESHHRAMLLEVMGRDSGWIALESGLAGGADTILIPEIPFRLDVIAEHIQRREQRPGIDYSLVVVAEGCAVEGHGQFTQPLLSSLDAPRLGGIGNWLAYELARRIDVEIRSTILGHLQRGGTPTVFDRILATRFGCEAVELIARGQFGRMVALRGQDVTSVALSEAVGTVRHVPQDSQLVRHARQLGVCLGDALPPHEASELSRAARPG